ncbi:hypothetical protein, partial [Faecalibaculum rodentium]
MTIVSYGSYYFSTKLAVGGFSQILYTLQNSMEGSESTWKEVVTDYFVRQWPWLIVGTLLYVFFVWYYLQRKKGDSHVQLWSI